jgi:hypothetical protein
MKSPLRQLHTPSPQYNVESPPDLSISTVLDIHEMIARQKNKRWINTCL